MPRRLNKLELGVLIRADRFGEIMPTTKDEIEACLKLQGHDLMGQHDAAPGVFFITAMGERAMAKALALKNAA